MADSAPPTFTQHFIVEGKYLGSAQRGLTFINGGIGAPQSYAFFCPLCGDLWARCPVEANDGLTEEFMVWTKCCKKHGRHSFDLPGSLYMAWDKSFSDSFPDELLREEFKHYLALCFSTP